MKKKPSAVSRKRRKSSKIAAFGPNVPWIATRGRVVLRPATPPDIDPEAIRRAVVKVSAA